MFDTLTDLVDFYKRKGIEEISGNWVHLKQVSWTFSHTDIADKTECELHLNLVINKVTLCEKL